MKLSGLIVKLLFALFAICSPAIGKNLEVCKSCNLSSISQAIKISQPGDIILISPELYDEGQIIIDKPITLKGKKGTILDGKNEAHVILIQSNEVTVESFEIRNSGVSDNKEFAGIYVDNAKNCKILSNNLVNNAYSIYLAKTEDCLVENNFIRGNAEDEIKGGNGIHLWSSERITIKKNKVSNHRDGFYFEFSNYLIIEDNEIFDSIRYGMHFMFANNNKFYNNFFHSNPTGVAIMYSKVVSVIKNRFEKNWGLNSYGILLKDISDGIFEKNVFTDNTIGIYSEGCNRNVFRENTISKNGWGAHVLGNSDKNKFENNIFYKNIFDLSTNSRTNTNLYEGNYWDKYNGYDLDGDGIGDKPHQPVQLFSFWIAKYPFLLVLFQSASIEFLEMAEKALPVMVPGDLRDNKPLMRKYYFNQTDKRVKL